MSSENIKPGYKRTEVGVIPEDWEASTVGGNSTWLSGGTPSRDCSDYWSGTIPWISGSTLKSIEISTSDQFLTQPGVFAGSKMAPINSTLLLVRGSALHKEIRAGLVIASVSFNQDVKALVPIGGLEPKFLTYYILAHSEELLKLVSSAGNSAGVLDTELVQNFKFLKPPHQEQLAIVNALSDVDALLAKLDQLIAKKRDLKQAAMQQLLTGQTRLPGFSGEWVENVLGKLGKITGAGVDKEINSNEIPVRLLNYMDVYQKDFLKANEFWHEVTAKPDQVKRCSVQRGDVFFTPSSEVRDDIGHSAVAIEDAHDVVYSYHVVRLRLSEVWDIGFRAYAFKTKRFLDQASTQCEGSGTRYVITLPKFRAMRVKYPVEVEEQTAIAAVLYDMDIELTALEARRDKTHAIKQGMMQELLTGRIRLI